MGTHLNICCSFFMVNYNVDFFIHSGSIIYSLCHTCKAYNEMKLRFNLQPNMLIDLYDDRIVADSQHNQGYSTYDSCYTSSIFALLFLWACKP